MNKNDTINYTELNRELFKKYKSGDYSARKQIIELNLPLVKQISKNYSKIVTISSDDLFQEGCCALIKAVDNYELQKNIAFSTYASSYIKGQLKNYINSNKYLFHIPKEKVVDLNLYSKLRSMGFNEDEIADRMNLSLDKLDKLIKVYERLEFNKELLDIDEEISDDTEDDIITYADTISGGETIDTAIDNVFYEELIKKLKDILKEQYLLILLMRYEVKDGKMPQKEIADYFNTTQQNISIMEHNAKKILENNDSIKQLNLYKDM